MNFTIFLFPQHIYFQFGFRRSHASTSKVFGRLARLKINVIILSTWHVYKKREKELKTREKIQLTAVPPGRFAGALYHDDAPRDFGPQIAYACWRWFQVTFPRPYETDPFRRHLSSTLLDFKLRFSHLFISQCSHRVFHVVHFEV